MKLFKVTDKLYINPEKVLSVEVTGNSNIEFTLQDGEVMHEYCGTRGIAEVELHRYLDHIKKYYG